MDTIMCIHTLIHAPFEKLGAIETLGKYIQEKEAILAANMSEINRKLFLILDYLSAFTK